MDKSPWSKEKKEKNQITKQQKLEARKEMALANLRKKKFNSK